MVGFYPSSVAAAVPVATAATVQPGSEVEALFMLIIEDRGA
jgi:hypothetical protein